MENLRNLLYKDAPLIDTDIPSVKQQDELLGLRLFKDALENYTQNPRLLEEFFRLTGTASRVLKDIQQAQELSYPVVSSFILAFLHAYLVSDWKTEGGSQRQRSRQGTTTQLLKNCASTFHPYRAPGARF